MNISAAIDSVLSSLFWIFLILMLAGLTFLYYQRTQPTILSFAAPPPPAISVDDTTSAPAHISIPSVNIDIAIEPGFITNNIWTISDHYANHLHTSAHPGSNGNIVVYGHNSRPILGNLTNVSEGDTIIITDSDNTEHRYTVHTTFTVTPDTMDPVQPTDEEILTVYTCTGLLNSKRFIVQAKPI
jgi:LPXTG-site transpeptidase (sortase) family protein